jgi:hypothetical protein
MFQVLILLCSLGLSPAECDEQTATSVLAGPPAANELECMICGQQYVASSALGETKAKDQFVKVRCTRVPAPERTTASLWKDPIRP